MTAATDRARLTDEVLAGYLGNYLERRRQRRAGRIFGSADRDALAALFLLRLGGRFGPGLPASAAAQEAALLLGECPEEPGIGADAHAFVALASAELAGLPRPRSIDDWLRPPEVGGPIHAAWRAAFLAEALREAGGAGREDAERELARWSAYLAQRLTALATTEGEDGARLGVMSQLVFLASGVVERHPDRGLRSACEGAVEALVRILERRADERGELPPDVATHELAQHLLAVASARRIDALEPLRRALLERHAPDGALLRTLDGSRFEASPWIPLALLELAERPDALAPMLAPAAPDPPQFSIAGVRSSEQALEYAVDVADTRLVREVDHATLNLLTRRALDFHARVEPERFSARSHADFVLGLCSLLDRCGDGPTRTRMEEQIEHSIEAILSGQANDGGWAFGRKGVPSYLYTGGTRSEREFPDLEYTLDAAVPGIALALRYGDTSEERLYGALERTLGFFEASIGRVEFGGRLIWRLFPEDEKTATTGTAVNYELWNGFFFASFAAVARDSSVRGRVLGYVDASVDYAEQHLDADGDIAYGDYVRERRTAYAAWDAMLLARIGELTGKERPMQLARRIVGRLAGLLLPSGAMPNVVDHVEELPAGRRWLVHRHGLGPYPIHSSYQLYYVAACALAGTEPAAALRALGFVLLDLFEPAFGNLGGGYAGDGEYHDKQGLFAASWVLLALGLLHRISAVEYQPDLVALDPHGARLMRAVEGIGEALFAQGERLTGAVRLDVERGAAALCAAGSRAEWLEHAPRTSTGALAGTERDVEALRSDAESGWRVFEAARAEGATPLAVNVLAGHALTLAEAADVLDEPRYVERAEALTSYLLHAYRGGGDQLLMSPVDRSVSFPEAAAAFASLARLIELGPPWTVGAAPPG